MLVWGMMNDAVLDVECQVNRVLLVCSTMVLFQKKHHLRTSKLIEEFQKNSKKKDTVVIRTMHRLLTYP